MKRRRKRGQGKLYESGVGVQTFCPACGSFTTLDIHNISNLFSGPLLQRAEKHLVETDGEFREK